MSVSSIGCSYAGPENPHEPVGEAKYIFDGLVSQKYADGTLYEISSPVGSPLVVYPLPDGGVWSQAFEHEGVLYISIWYPNLGSQHEYN